MGVYLQLEQRGVHVLHADAVVDPIPLERIHQAVKNNISNFR